MDLQVFLLTVWENLGFPSVVYLFIYILFMIVPVVSREIVTISQMMLFLPESMTPYIQLIRAAA